MTNLKSILDNNIIFNVYFNSLLETKLFEKLTFEKKPEYIINPKLKKGNKIPYYDASGKLTIGVIKTELEDTKDITLELTGGEVVEYQVGRNANAKYWLMYDISPVVMEGLILGIGSVDNSEYAPLIISN